LRSDSNESHTRVVFNTSATKLVNQEISNMPIQATNDWLKKFEGQAVTVFREGSISAGTTYHSSFNYVSCDLNIVLIH
jgi:hypothetical protein